jgi:thymidylate kinase
MYIVIDGCWDSGKSVHAGLLTQYLNEKGIPTIETSTPGGSKLADHLLDATLEEMDSMTKWLLDLASVNENYHEVIAPALAEGKWVVCDRWAENWLAGSNILNLRSPDYTFILDVKPQDNQHGHHIDAKRSSEEVQNEIRTILKI